MILKALAYLLLAASTLLPAFITNSIFGYLPFLFLLFLSMFSFLYGLLLKNFFHYINIADTYSCEREKELDFSVHMKNNSFLIYPRIEAIFYISDIYGNERFHKSVEYVLAPYEEKAFNLTMKFDHIGTYHAGLKHIKIYSLMGIKHYRLSSAKEFQITVTPKIHNYIDSSFSDKISLQTEASMTAPWKSGMEYAGVREYAAGDSLKSIHWNLSAHSSHLMTKKYETQAAHGISILLDLQAPDYTEDILMQMFDCIVESALSIAHQAKKQGHPYEILYHKEGFTKHYAPPHFYELNDFISDLPNITPDSKQNSADRLLEEYCSSNESNNRSVILCTSNLSQNIIHSLILLKNTHKNPMLYYAKPEFSEPKERVEDGKSLNTLDEYHISYKVINSAKDLRKAS